MSLSEGLEDPSLLITGTSFLNSGKRLFEKDRSSEEIYQAGLKIKHLIDDPDYLINLNEHNQYLSRNIVSLSDVEMACRLYMTDFSKRNHLFRYCAIADYDESSQIDVPLSVSIIFINLTKKKVLLKATLLNE